MNEKTHSVLSEATVKQLKAFVRATYRPAERSKSGRKVSFKAFSHIAKKEAFMECAAVAEEAEIDSVREPAMLNLAAALKKEDLAEAVRSLDESFTEMLLRKIDESGMKDAECYKKAGVDRKLFSKIRSDRAYRPSKVTAIAFAFALSLPETEAEDLLKKAGFALSDSNVFDVIVRFFLRTGRYDMFELNEALLLYDQPLIGV